jgi:hypothetical protein
MINRIRLAIALTTTAIVLTMTGATVVASIQTMQAASDLKRDAEAFRAEKRAEAACGPSGRRILFDGRGVHITYPDCPIPIPTTTIARTDARLPGREGGG